jgi:hypothetical protein
MREMQGGATERYCTCDMFESSSQAEAGLNLIYYVYRLMEVFDA